jgi:hypothetical protein
MYTRNSPARSRWPRLRRLAAGAAALAALAPPATVAADSIGDPSRAGAAKRHGCGKSQITVGPRSKPRACVPRKLRVDDPNSLRPMLALARRAPRGSRKTQRLALKVLRWATTRGVPELAPAKKGARASQRRRNARDLNLVGEPTELGATRSMERRGDDRIVGTFENEDGIETRLDWRYDAETGDDRGVLINARARNGVGATMGLEKGPRPPECPTAAGDVPARYLYGLTIGHETVEHGKRTFTLANVRVEGRWHGYVGVGAKAEKFDVSLRGVTEVRSGVEIAATGKTLKRDPTRVFRAALDKRGLPVRTRGASLVKDIRLRGPQGNRYRAEYLKPAGNLLWLVAEGVDAADKALEEGDKRWYDEMRCAKLESTHSPDRVTKGGRADWKVTALAADGTKVANADWGADSGCGEVSTSGTGGPTVDVTLVDVAGAWGWDPYQPACAVIGATTPAGRPRAVYSTIPPVEPPGDLRVTVSFDYEKRMGVGIAESLVHGSGEFLMRPDGQYYEGSGSYRGVEWDQTPDNTCGEDMTRSRDIAGATTVGGQHNGDGTITVGITGNEKPQEFSWIVTVPETGGTETITNRQTFCGEPNLAARKTVITVTVTRAA